MNRYTGTARRIIAAISCAAMVVSNMGSSITTITAYADEIDTADLQNTTATDGATTPTGDIDNTGDNSGTNNDGDHSEIVVEPIVQEETNEDKAVAETPEEKKDDTSNDTSNEEQKENTSDDTSNEEQKETTSDDTSNEEQKENTSTGTSDEEKKETSTDTSTEDKKDDASDADTTDEKKDESSDAKSNKLTGFEEDEETETKVTDETANITFEADYIGYYSDYVTVTDEETGEETEEEQQLTKTIHDSQTLTIDKDNAYAAGADTAPTIDGWAYDYITIDDEDYYDGASIAIVDEKDETNNTETIYYTVDGNRIPASTESRTIKITYLYMSTENTDGETLALTEHDLHVYYHTGHYSVDLQNPYVQYWNGSTWVTIDESNYKTLGLTAVPDLSKTGTDGIYKVSLPDKINALDTDDTVYRINGTVPENYITKWVDGPTVSNEVAAPVYQKNLAIFRENSQSATFDWNDGANSYDTRTLLTTSDKKFGVKTNTDQSYEGSTTDKSSPYYYELQAFKKNDDGTYSAVGTPNDQTALQSADRWVLTYPNLPEWDGDGTELEYYIQPPVSDESISTDKLANITDAKYASVYSNPKSNDTTKVILGDTQTKDGAISADQSEGGVATFTLTGKTSYATTKKWIDDGNTDRSGAEVSLYRYPDNAVDKDGNNVGIDGNGDGKGYQIVSAVDGAYLGVSLDSSSTNNDVKVEVGTDNRGTTTITIGQKTTTSGDEGGESTSTAENTLEAFNSDGYKYNYTLKESKSATDYQTMYWDGKQYVAVEENYVVNAGTTSDSNKKVFYNVNTKTTSESYSKKFDAKAIQDEKYDVKVYLYETTDEYVYEHQLTKDVTAEESSDHKAHKAATLSKEDILTGFSEKKTEASGSFSGLAVYNQTSAPTTDEAGQKNYYFVVEGAVRPAGGDENSWVEPTTDENGNTYIVINGYRYQQTIEEEKDKDDNVTGQIITNTLVANAKLEINKTFPDGLGYTDKDKKEKITEETVTYAVYKKGTTEPIGYYQYTYKDSDIDANNGGKVSTPAIEKYSDLFKDKACKTPLTDAGYLERYNENGEEIEYAIREVATTGYGYEPTTTSSHKDDIYGDEEAFPGEHYLHFTSNINNHLEGDGAAIKVHKDWVDDSMTMYRQDITVDVEMKLTIDSTTEKDWTKIAGGTIRTDEAEIIVGIDDDQINKVFNISYANASTMVGGWQSNKYKPVTVTLTETKDETTTKHTVVVDIRVREKTVGDADVHNADDSDYTTTVTTKDYPEHKSTADGFVSTTDQNYDITYQTAAEYKGTVTGDDPADYYITNTRVGTILATFDKTWVDGNDKLGERPTKIALTLQATVNGQPYNVWSDADGEPLNPATGEIADTASTDGKVPTSATVYRDAESAADLSNIEKGSQRVYELTASNQADGNSNKWTLRTGNLRKYTDKGEVITYTVVGETMYKMVDGKETAITNVDNKYTASYGSMNEESSTVGDHHTNDKEIFDVKNSLSDSVDLVINKVWEDDGTAASVAKRPDIYPAVYRAVKTNDNKGYDVNSVVKLTYIQNDWSQIEKTNNWWVIKLKSQPRYADGSQTGPMTDTDGTTVLKDQKYAEGTEFVYFIGEEWSAVVRNDYVQAGSFNVEPQNDADHIKTHTVGAETVKVVNFEDSETDANRTKITSNDSSVFEGEVVKIDYKGKDSEGKEIWSSGTIVNRAVINLYGSKVWESEQDEYKIDNMPDLHFELYQLDATTAAAWIKDHPGDGTAGGNWDGVFADDSSVKNNLVKITTDADGYEFTSDEHKAIQQQNNKINKYKTFAENAVETISWTTVNGLDYSWSNLRKSGIDGDYVYLIKETLADTTATTAGKLENYYSFHVVDGSDGYRATNTYKPDKALSITFTKNWNVPLASTVEMDPEPAILVTLVRYQTDGKNVIIGSREAVDETTVEVETTTDVTGTGKDDVALKYSDKSVKLTFKNDKNQKTTQKDTITWSNLPKIGTNLQPYAYYIEETSAGTSLDGMEVTTTTWNASDKTAWKTGSATESTDKTNFEKVEITKDNKTILESAIVKVKLENNTGSAELANTYGSVKGAIKIQKIWENSETTTTSGSGASATTTDKYLGLKYLKATLGSSYTVDPTYPDLAITVHRKTTTGSSNISDQTLQEGEYDKASSTTTLTKDALTGYINNVEEHSSLGDEYSYWIDESVKKAEGDTSTFDLLQYYKKTVTQYAVALHKKDAETSWEDFDKTLGNDNLTILTNTPILETLTVSKEWYTKEGDAGAKKVSNTNDLKDLYDLGVLPDSITYIIQYRIEGQEGWSNLTSNGTNAVEVVGKKGNDYKYIPSSTDYPVLTSLPSYVFTTEEGAAVAKKVSYQAVETKMLFNEGKSTKNTVDRKLKDKSTTEYKDTIGGLNVAETTTATEKAIDNADNKDKKVHTYTTTVKNTIPVKTLTVRKLWDDESDRDKKRPTSTGLAVTISSVIRTEGQDDTVIGKLTNKKLTTTIAKTNETRKANEKLSLPLTDDNSAYSKYATDYLTSQNRPMTLYDIWEYSIVVPTVNAAGANVSYKIEETNSGISSDYTKSYAFTYDKAKSEWGWTDVTSGTPTIYLAADSDDKFVATFANARTKATLTIDPQKVFSGSIANTWGKGTYDQYTGKWTYSIPANAKGYIQKLADNKLAFQLTYKQGNNMSQYAVVDFTQDLGHWGIEKKVVDGVTTYSPVMTNPHVVNFDKDASGNVTFTTDLTNAANVTFSFSIDDWENLPLYWYNDGGNTSAQISYQVQEVVESGSKYVALNDKDSAVKDYWNAPSVTYTDAANKTQNAISATSSTTYKATISNSPKGKKVTASKKWATQTVDKDGKNTNDAAQSLDPTATGLTEAQVTERQNTLKKLDAYNALPESITYTVQYRTEGSTDETAWTDYKVYDATVTADDKMVAKTITGLRTSDETNYTYSNSLDNLPAYGYVNDAVVEVEYRALETKMTFVDSNGKDVSVDRTVATENGKNDTFGNTEVTEANAPKSATDNSEYTTTTTNTIKMRQLTIQKIWDDEENRDDKRASALKFTFNRDGKDVTVSSTVDGTLAKLESTNAVGNNTPTNTAYTNYVKVGTSISGYSVWQGTITIPYSQNTAATASTYQITEAVWDTEDSDDFATYTHRAYQKSDSAWAWSALTTKGGDADVKNNQNVVAISADESEFIASYANVRGMDTFEIEPSKAFSTTAGTGVSYQDGTYTIPTTYVAAVKALQGKVFFQLSYSIDGGKTWDVVGSDTWKKNAGAYANYKPVTITDPVQSGNDYTFTVSVGKFTDLPKVWYNGYKDNKFSSTTIQYKVEEVFKSGESYKLYDQLTDSDSIKSIIDQWKSPAPKTEDAVIITADSQTKAATITNQPKTITVEATKVWKTQLGTADAKQIYPSTDSNAEIERLDKNYGALPDSITYQIQYREKGNTTATWQDYTGYTMTGYKVDQKTKATTYNYPASMPNLPEIQGFESNGKITYKAVEYRAIETAMSYSTSEATGDGLTTDGKTYTIDQITISATNATVKEGEAIKSYKTTVTNTIPMRTLTIEKLWDDEDDRDDLRPETAGLTFKVYRDVTGTINEGTTVSGTASMKQQNDAVSALPTTGTDTAYDTYVSGHLNGRIMSKASVWSTAGQTAKLTVPYYQNGKSDASVYTVIESGVDSNSYTSYAYDETSNNDDKWVEGTTAKTASGLAVFANQHNRDTFSIQPAKFFINNVDNTARWGETQNTTNGIVTSVTYTVPVEDLAYFKKLESHGLAFQLSYELDGQKVTNVHPVTFEYKEDDTVKVSVTPWTNLPVNQYNSETLEPTKIKYTVVEGFGSGDSFKAYTDTALDSAIQNTLHDWAFNISGSTTEVTGSDENNKIVPVQSWAIKNQAGYDSLSITKNWTGVVDGNSSNTLTEEQVKAYDEKYGFMPDSITYQIQYRAKGTTGAWSDYDYKGDASLVGLKAHDYEVTIPYLPAFTTSGTSSIQVEYRAVEKSLKYGDTTVPASGSVTYTDTATAEGCNNTTTGTIGGFQSTSNTTYPNDEATKGTTTNGYSTNIINIVSFNTLTVEKLWDDEENRDELRPTSISIEVRRDGNTGNADDTVVLTQDKAVAFLTDNNAPYKAYKDQKILGNRPMTQYSVWSDTILVPAAQNTSTTASQYVITEQFADEATDSANYATVYYYNSGAWSNSIQNVTISASTTGFVAAFANRHDKLTLTINPQKTFTDTAAKWSTATDEEGNIAENADGSITITIPTADDGYINVLRQYTLAFELAYSLDGTTYKPVNPEDVDIWGLDKATDLKAVHEVTLTAPTSATVDGKAVLQFTSKIDDWTDLPLYLYANHSKEESKQQQIQYMVEEGFVINGTFYSIAEITDKDQSEIKAADKTAAEEIAEVLNDWKAPEPKAVAAIRATKDTETDQRTIKATINNAPQKVNVEVSKAWQQTDNVDADGNIIAGATLDAADYAYLEKWGALPTSITYQIQYRAKSDNKGVNATWYDYEDGEDKGLLNAKAETKADGTTDYTFAASRKSLPAFMQIGETATEVVYRVIESQLTYADGSVAKVHNNDVTFKAAADSNANSVDAVYYDTLSLQGRENTERTTGIDSNTSAAYTTAVTNIVKLRALTIEKIWDDEENRDGNREETLSFQIKRDVQSGEAETFTGSLQTVTMYKDAAVEQEADKDKTDVGTTVKGVPTDANDPANIYKAAHSERSIEGNSIWNKTVTVPYGANTGLTTSSYKVVEVVPETMTTNLYTTQAYAGGGANGWKDGNALTGKTVGTTDPIAAFANIRNKDTFHVQPVKDWQYLGATATDKWVNVKDNVETIDAEVKAYFEMLQNYEFGFILTYKTGDMKEFLPVDVNPNGKSADEDKAVVQQLGDLYSVHLVDFTFDPADTTNGKVTMTTNVEPWENLPYYWYDAETLKSTPIEYQVREGFMIDDKFVTVEDFFQDEDTPVTASVLGAISGLGNKVKAALGNDAAQTREALNTALKAWTSMTDTSPVPMTEETKVANVAKGATYSAPFQNEFATNQLTVTKEWDDDENSAGLRPETLRYVVTYALESEDETAFRPVPDAWLNDVNTEDGIGLEDVTIDGVATRYVTVDVAADGKTAATAVITSLPMTNEQGEAYAYEAYELEDESIEIYSSETVTTANKDGSFTTAIKNTLFTVNATIDKTWDDPFGFTDNVHDTTYTLQRIEYIMGEDFTEVTGDWQNVTYADLAGAKDNTGAKIDKTGAADGKTASDAYTVTIAGVSPETISLTMLRGIKGRNADGQLVLYAYRFIESSMVVADDGQTKGTTAQPGVSTDLTNGNDGGYTYSSTFDQEKGTLPFEIENSLNKTYHTHIKSYMPRAQIIATKAWNDKYDWDNIRPNSVTISLEMAVKSHEGTVAFEPKAAGLAAEGQLERSKDYRNAETWAVVPVRDAYGDIFTYTFDELCPNDYQITSAPDSFEFSADGQIATLEWCNFHYVPDTNGGGEPQHTDDTPVPPTPTKKVVPVEDPKPTEETTDETPGGDESSSESTSDPRGPRVEGNTNWGYYDEYGNWHWLDEEGSIGTGSGDGGDEMGDASLMNFYGVVAAMSATVLAAWFVLYRRKREEN